LLIPIVSATDNATCVLHWRLPPPCLPCSSAYTASFLLPVVFHNLALPCCFGTDCRLRVAVQNAPHKSESPFALSSNMPAGSECCLACSRTAACFSNRLLPCSPYRLLLAFPIDCCLLPKQSASCFCYACFLHNCCLLSLQIAVCDPNGKALAVATDRAAIVHQASLNRPAHPIPQHLAPLTYPCLPRHG
jgi:hypothetical protein